MMPKPRLAFMGTPDFSVPILRALADGDYDIAAVYCQPPRAAGRGQKEKLSPVHQVALSLDIEVRTPASLKPEDVQRDFFGLELDVAVVAAYGLSLYHVAAEVTIREGLRTLCLTCHFSNAGALDAILRTATLVRLSRYW